MKNRFNVGDIVIADRDWEYQYDIVAIIGDIEISVKSDIWRDYDPGTERHVLPNHYIMRHAITDKLEIGTIKNVDKNFELDKVANNKDK